MQQSENGSVATRSDPIWHRLRVEFFWYLVVVILLFVFIVNSLRSVLNSSDSSIVFLVFLDCIYLLVLIKIVVDRFYLPSYWRRIGQRRDAALHGVQHPATPFQPLHSAKQLALPTTFSLRLNRITLIVGGICGVLAVASWITFAFILFEQLDINSNLFFVLSIVFGILFTCVLIVSVFYYFVFLRYHMQRIEINEEGLRVYYMRQERFLRWDEMRVFATYGVKWAARSNQMRAYEVASEQMVVRWSQLPAVNIFLSVESSRHTKEDWNWLVGRLNTCVTEQTSLTLLDLGDKAAKRAASQSALQTPAPQPVIEMSAPQSVPDTSAARQESNVGASSAESIAARIAQNDTLVESLQWSGDTGNVVKGLGVISVVLIVLGVMSFSAATKQYLSFLSSIWGNGFLFYLGIFLFLLTLLMVLSLWSSQKYWRRIAALRVNALAQLWPATEAERPLVSGATIVSLPTNIHIRYRRVFIFLITFFVTFIGLFAFFYALSHQKNVWLIAIPSLAIALFASLLQTSVFVKARENRIEVTEDGIATHMNILYHYLPWEDVRLFSKYRTMSMSGKKSATMTYELAGEKTVVRLMGADKNWSFFLSQPKMSRAEFESWHAQLADYIEQRTQLPLIDLDDLNEVKSDTSINRS